MKRQYLDNLIVKILEQGGRSTAKLIRQEVEKTEKCSYSENYICMRLTALVKAKRITRVIKGLYAPKEK